MKVGDTVKFKTKHDTRLKEGEIIGDPWRVYYPDGLWAYEWDEVTEIIVVEPPYEPQNGDVVWSREALHSVVGGRNGFQYVRFNDLWWRRATLMDQTVARAVKENAATVERDDNASG